jgi:hypothetical protein
MTSLTSFTLDNIQFRTDSVVMNTFMYLFIEEYNITNVKLQLYHYRQVYFINHITKHRVIIYRHPPPSAFIIMSVNIFYCINNMSPFDDKVITIYQLIELTHALEQSYAIFALLKG